MCKITVIDSPCGAGKTQKMIEMMNTNNDNHYIYVTPFLKEVARIKASCKDIAFYEPKCNGKGAKSADLKRLLKKGFNVVTTHSLFKAGDNELKSILETQKYTLILDEVMDVVEVLDELCSKDIKLMVEGSIINIDDITKQASWDESYPAKGIFNNVKHYFKNNSVFIYNNNAMLWTFPIELFDCFKHIYICTYMFDAQIQKYYYDLYKAKYELVSVSSGEIIPYRKETMDASNLTIFENEKLNAIGENKYALSKNWYLTRQHSLDKNAQKEYRQVKNNIRNFFTNIMKSPADDLLWTIFEPVEDDFKGKGYTSGLQPSNLRATNDFITKHNVAYPINKFLHPTIGNFFKDRGIEVDENAYALSEMVQFIWRSAIRIKEPTTVYVPSKRMRTLLNLYKKYGFIYSKDVQF